MKCGICGEGEELELAARVMGEAITCEGRWNRGGHVSSVQGPLEPWEMWLLCARAVGTVGDVTSLCCSHLCLGFLQHFLKNKSLGNTQVRKCFSGSSPNTLLPCLEVPSFIIEESLLTYCLLFSGCSWAHQKLRQSN